MAVFSLKTLADDAGESSTIGEEVKNMYQIHEVCERCHLSRKAVRLYEEKGLLHPGRIQGNRIYNKEDVLRLHCISYYRGLGFSLEQIQQLLHGSSEKCLKELLVTHKEQLNRKLEEKQEQLRAVKNVIHAIRQHEEFDITAAVSDEQRDDDCVEEMLIWKWNFIYQIYDYRCSRKTYRHAVISTRLFCAILVIVLVFALLEKGGIL